MSAVLKRTYHAPGFISLGNKKNFRGSILKVIDELPVNFDIALFLPKQASVVQAHWQRNERRLSPIFFTRSSLRGCMKFRGKERVAPMLGGCLLERRQHNPIAKQTWRDPVQTQETQPGSTRGVLGRERGQTKAWTEKHSSRYTQTYEANKNGGLARTEPARRFCENSPACSLRIKKTIQQTNYLSLRADAFDARVLTPPLSPSRILSARCPA